MTLSPLVLMVMFPAKSVMLFEAEGATSATACDGLNKLFILSENRDMMMTNFFLD